MLKQRVITALVLLAVLLPTLFLGPVAAFVTLVLVLIAAAAWEWARLNGLGRPGSVASGLACVLLCALSWRLDLLAPSRPLFALWLVCGAAWVLLGAWALRGGVPAWSGLARSVRLALGLLALWLAWLAVAKARVLGINFLLSVMALVWVADIAAYFSGRAWGGRFSRGKLAPSISPGKSWEGVWGAMVAASALAFGWRWVDAALQVEQPSFFTLAGAPGPVLLLLSVVFLVAISVVGDLFESLVKRSAGVKDSSGLLPGHGGVLDRVDALLPALPLAMMLYTVVAAR